MQVRVLFFGILKDLAGRESDELSLPESATAGDVIEYYDNSPRLRGRLKSTQSRSIRNMRVPSCR